MYRDRIILSRHRPTVSESGFGVGWECTEIDLLVGSRGLESGMVIDIHIISESGLGVA